MPVLDEVTFVDGGKTFGEVRLLRQELQLIKEQLIQAKSADDETQTIEKSSQFLAKRREIIVLYRTRLERRLIGQTDCLTDSSPFVKATMTSIGIETLGLIFYPKETDEMPAFVNAIHDLEPAFRRTLEEGFITGAKQTYPELEIEKISTYGHFLYKYFRNSMIHGFWGRAVFLSYEECQFYRIQDGYMVLNPNGFWNLFKNLFKRLFDEVIISADIDDQKVANCLFQLDKTIRFIDKEKSDAKKSKKSKQTHIPK